MLAVLPLACFALIYVTVLHDSPRVAHRPDPRSSFLLASVIWGVILTAFTEALSMAHSLTRGSLSAAWALACVASAVVYYRRRARQERRRLLDGVSGMPTSLAWLLFGAGVIVLTVGLIGLLAPPNNWDSMTYHMSRVAHWIQNRSVAHYPTNIPRQLQLAPWAEFAVMNFQLLTGGDRFANTVQWFGMAGGLLGVSLIAQQLGAGVVGQVFAVVFAVTIPMGILQGSSAQNDHVVSFWVICLVYYALSAVKQNRYDLSVSLLMGASVGLAALTKSTAYVYALPFIIWTLWSAAKRLRWQAWRPVLVIALVALAINIGHYSRNARLYGSVHGDDGTLYTNDVVSPGVVVSNVTRNLSLHVGTPLGSVNDVIDGGVRLFLTTLGIDPNDPRTTWFTEEFRVIQSTNHEDTAGNPIHLLLLLVSVGVYLFGRHYKSQPTSGRYIIACVAAFLLFCTVLKWQPWHSRLHLPLFVLSSAFIATVLDLPERRKLATALAAILLVAAQPWVLYNYSRPLIPLAFEVGGIRTLGGSNVFADRYDQYFSNRPELKDPYVGAADLVTSKNCSEVGLQLQLNDWEYPFWMLLQRDGREVRRVEHVNVNNKSAETAATDDPFVPCAIIAVYSNGAEAEELTVGSQVYAREWSSGPVGVYLR